jgi:hypothetical protein
MMCYPCRPAFHSQPTASASVIRTMYQVSHTLPPSITPTKRDIFLPKFLPYRYCPGQGLHRGRCCSGDGDTWFSKVCWYLLDREGHLYCKYDEKLKVLTMSSMKASLLADKCPTSNVKLSRSEAFPVQPSSGFKPP